MMSDISLQIINQVVIPIAGTIVSIAGAIIAKAVKDYWNKNSSLVEAQKQQVIQKIGIDKYNADVQTVKEAVYSVEQQAKEFDWQGEMKHSKVLDMIEGKTGLTAEQEFNLIKGFVLEVNKLSKSDTDKTSK